MERYTSTETPFDQAVSYLRGLSADALAAVYVGPGTPPWYARLVQKERQRRREGG